MEIICLLCIIFTVAGPTRAAWNDLNCPAPRAPDNGLSFIFRNGELVHFRCHPGYVMRGKPVAYCVNNVWTEPTPECIAIKKWPQVVHDTPDRRVHSRRHQNSSQQRELFSWNHSNTTAYGDGPRRLPLINGIWPSQDHADRVLALGPQSTPGPKALVEEEINIAELRHRQLEEVKKQRYLDLDYGDKRKRGHKKKYDPSLVDPSAPRETVISLGKTEDGDALSIAFAKPDNDTDRLPTRHRYRHHDGRKKRRRGSKKKRWHPTQSGFIVARQSRVDTSGISPYHTRHHFNHRQPALDGNNEVVAELRRRPVERVRHHRNDTGESMAQFDASCLESLYGRDVPMIAPQVPNAFVYRYETKKNKLFPFNSYMQVKYRCLSGYAFADARAQTLRCKEASWMGEVPRCVENRIFS